MMFFALMGAISFCVFIAMYLNNMLASTIKNRSWILVAFVGASGIIARSVPQLSTFSAVGIIGLLAGTLLASIYRNALKGIITAVFFVALLFGIEGLTLLFSRLLGYESDSILFIPIYRFW